MQRDRVVSPSHVMIPLPCCVPKGGGECGVDNLRTLCVLCHSEVTRVQTAQRAAARRIAKENERRWVQETFHRNRVHVSCFFFFVAMLAAFPSDIWHTCAKTVMGVVNDQRGGGSVTQRVPNADVAGVKFCMRRCFASLRSVALLCGKTSRGLLR